MPTIEVLDLQENALPKASAGGREETESQYELYIMRHGIAVPRGDPAYPDDALRPMTPRGRKKLQEIGKGLRRLGVKVDWVVTSPLVRAAETAEIVGKALGSAVPVESSDTLKPGRSADSLISFLAKHPSRKRTLLVGHEPGLSELAARFIGAGRNAKFALKKGGCCKIVFSEFPPKSPGELVWWLTPRVMREIA